MHSSLALIARKQAGAFSREQALRFHSERTVRRRVHDRDWSVVLPGTYCAAATPQTRALRVHAGVLYAGTGARVSHQTAAAVFAIDADGEDDVFVTVPHHRKVEDQPGLRIARSRQLAGAHVTTRRGIPLTSAARTIVDLACAMPRPAFDAALSDAIRHGLVTTDYVRRIDDRLVGRRQPSVLRDVLAEFDPDLESVLEREFVLVLAGAGVPLGEPQHEVWDGPLLVARVDFAYVDGKLAVEVDGYRYHSLQEQLDRDRRRERGLARRGWDVVRFTTSDVRGDPAAVVADVRARLRMRAAA